MMEEGLLLVLFKKSPVAQWIFDPETLTVMEANEKAEKLFGRDSLANVHLLELQPGDEHDRFLRFWNEHKDAEVKHHVHEWQLLGKDHSLTAEVNCNELIYRQKRAIHAAILDITEKHHLADQLSFHSNILKAVRSSIIVTDKQGIISFWNKGAELLFGYTMKEMLGKTMSSLYVPGDPEQVERHVNSMQAEEEHEGEMKARSKSGKEVWVQLRTSMMYDSNGNSTGFIGVAKDISSQKQAELAYQESEKKYRNIVESSDEIIFTTNVMGKITFINQRVTEIIGFPPEYILGRSIYTFTPRALLREHHEAFSLLLKQGHIRQFIARIVRKDHTSLILSINANCIRDERGKITGINGIARDITQSRKTYEKLKHSEAVLRAFFESVESTFVMLDRNYKVILFNGAARAFYENVFGKEITQGVDFFDIISPDLHDETFQLFQKIKKKRTLEREKTFETRSGKIIHTLCHYSSVRTEENDFIGISISSIDITERRNNEVLLQRSSANLRATLDSTDEAIVLIDKKYHVIVFNEQAQKNTLAVTGKKMEEGANFLQYVSAETQDPFIKFISKAIEEGTQRTVSRLGPEEKPFWFETRFFPVKTAQNDVLGVCLSVKDITREKHDEQKIKEQNEALQKTNFELDRFYYSTSHELRAPLTSMQGLLKIAGAEIVEENTLAYLNMLEECVNKLNKTISNIAEFSNNSGRGLSLAFVNVRKLMNEVVFTAKEKKLAEDILLTADFEGNDLAYTDGQRIQTIISNLVYNACIFSDPVKANKKVNISLSNSDACLKICVEDNGIGIEEKYLEKIFNMFYRVSESNSGGGLGLYLVKEILRKMKGSIYVNSMPGAGSSFTIEIPVQQNKLMN